MTRNQVPFFATHNDLVSLAREVANVMQVDFVLGGQFSEPTPRVLGDPSELKPFENYLVVERGVSVKTRAIAQRTGGQMYAVDQLNNPQSVLLSTGGRHTDQHLISGQAGTVGDGKEAGELYSLFAKCIRKRFERIKSFYVGPEAVAMLDRGARLSATLKAPSLYDLVR